MATFSWKGIQDGELTEGELTAKNIAEAKQQLRSMKIAITQLDKTGGDEDKENHSKAPEPQAAKPVKLLKNYRANKIKPKNLMIFTKKLGTMVAAGLPILKTLKMLEDQTDNPHLKVVVSRIYNDVESGNTLSDAFSKHPKVFDTVYINLLRSGETSGKLTFFLQRLTQNIEKSEKIRRKVKGAMMYPIILLLVAISVILIMLIKVVPVFEQMFSSVGNALPGPTQLIVAMSEFMRAPAQGGVMIGILIASFIVLKMLIKNNYNVRKKFHGYLLRIPIVRDVVRRSTLAKIAMIEGNLSAAGVSVLEALDIIHNSINNILYKEALQSVKQGVAEGRPLSTLYELYPNLFEPTFSQMIAVGEETGNIDEMFNSIANYYEEEFDMVVDRLTEMLEPLMIVFMGGTIGFMLVAMYMPIFQIGQTVSGGG